MCLQSKHVIEPIVTSVLSSYLDSGYLIKRLKVCRYLGKLFSLNKQQCLLQQSWYQKSVVRYVRGRSLKALFTLDPKTSTFVVLQGSML